MSLGKESSQFSPQISDKNESILFIFPQLAFEEASPCILEPVMAVEIVAPNETQVSSFILPGKLHCGVYKRIMIQLD